MVLNFYPKHFFYRRFDRLDSWITKFNYFTGVSENNVVMLFIPVRFLKLSDIFTKLVLANQVACK